MCNGESAPQTLGACNDFDCVNYAMTRTSNYPDDPLLWTENEGWFQQWDVPTNQTKAYRKPEEIAYAIARWFAIGGAHHNYYMYYGGNNFGRSAGAAVTQMYADGVNLYSDGLDNEPKRSHLKKLHNVLALYQHELLQHDIQLHHPIFLNQSNHAHRMYQYGDFRFVENQETTGASLTIGQHTYFVAARSMLLVHNDKVVYNTSNVVTKGLKTQRQYEPLVRPADWKMWAESPTNPWYRKQIQAVEPSEQLRLTQDITDYLIYTTQLIAKDQSSHHLNITTCESSSLLIYVDGTFIGEVNSPHHVGNCSRSLALLVPPLSVATHNLSIVSISMGIGNANTLHSKGITGDILYNEVSLRRNGWRMYPGTRGETLQIYRAAYRDSVPWQAVPNNLTPKPLQWYASTFNLPARTNMDFVKYPILVDCKGLGRGRIYVNGFDVGRYWMRQYNQSYVQQYYFIPPEYIFPTDNYLVVLEELGVESLDTVRIVQASVVDPMLLTG